MSVVSLPSSFLECSFLVAAGWFSTSSQASLLRPSVKKAAVQLMRRVTFPAFVFQVLAAGEGALMHSAQVACTAAFLHMVLCFGSGWFITRRQHQQQRAILAVLCLGYEAETWGVAWCSVMWGIAGAQVAVVITCAAAILYPMFTFVVGSLAAMGIPSDLKHADGGVYTGQWNRASKSGLGVYRHANGARYEGWWKNNMKHGRGVYIYADGGRFEGEFVKGARHGIGVRIWPHGTVKAALFEDNVRIREVDLAEAAHVMQLANEAANEARCISPTRLTLSTAAWLSFSNAPVITCFVFMMAAAVSFPVTESMEAALATAASIHIPLGLVLFGANMPKSSPQIRHVPQIRTVLSCRLLSALIVAAGALMCAASSEYAIETAAVAACLLLPVSSEALARATAWKLNNALVEGVAVTSTLLSAVCMGLFSTQAWLKDVVPVFAVMSTRTINTFPLVDHCFVQFGMISLLAYCVPLMFSRKVVRMTLKSSSIWRQGQHHNAELSPNDPPTSGDMRPGSAGAFTRPMKRESGIKKHIPGVRSRKLPCHRTRIASRTLPKSGHSRPTWNL